MVVEAISATAYTFIGFAVWDLGATGSLEILDGWADLEQVVVTRAYGRPQASTSGAMEGNLTPAITVAEAAAAAIPPTRYYGTTPQEPAIVEVLGTATVAGPAVVWGGALVAVPIIAAAGMVPAPLISTTGVVRTAGGVLGSAAVVSPSILPRPAMLVVGEAGGVATSAAPSVAAARTLVVPTITSAADLRNPAAVEGTTAQDLAVQRVTGTGSVEAAAVALGAIVIVVDAVVGDADVSTAGLLVVGEALLSPGQIEVTGSVETVLIFTLPQISDVAGEGSAVEVTIVAGGVTVAAPLVIGTGGVEELRILYGTSVLQELYADPAVAVGTVLAPTVGYGGAAACTAEVITATGSVLAAVLVPGPAIPQLSYTIDARGAIAMGVGVAIGLRKTEEWGPVAVQLNCEIEVETRVCVVIE